MKVLLVGPPGSGKGTQGTRLSERLGIEHIASGDLLRAEVDAGTPLGAEVADLLRRGELVPDETIIALLRPRIAAAAAAGGYLLDGFPRTVAQAVEARRMADDIDAAADAVIYLDVPRDQLITRILERAKEQGRADDNAETVDTRLHVFDEVTRPLVDYYRERGILHVIDATGKPDDVTEAILRELTA